MEQQYIPITHKRLFPYTKNIRNYLFGEPTLKNRSWKYSSCLGFHVLSKDIDIDVNFDNYSSNSETVRNKRIFKEYNVFSSGNSNELYNYRTTGLNLASISNKYYRNRL